MSNFDRDQKSREPKKWKAATLKRGFPPSDEFSYECSDNLEHWFTIRSRFVQNEYTNHCKNNVRSTYYLECTPVLSGTTTFSVYVGRTAVQVGYDKNGKLYFDKLGDPEIYAESGNINLATGEITINFNKTPPDNFLVINYEFHQECDGQ